MVFPGADLPALRRNFVDFVTQIFYKYPSSRIAHDHRCDVRVAVGVRGH